MKTNEMTVKDTDLLYLATHFLARYSLHIAKTSDSHVRAWALNCIAQRNCTHPRLVFALV